MRYINENKNGEVRNYKNFFLVKIYNNQCQNIQDNNNNEDENGEGEGEEIEDENENQGNQGDQGNQGSMNQSSKPDDSKALDKNESSACTNSVLDGKSELRILKL